MRVFKKNALRRVPEGTMGSLEIEIFFCKTVECKNKRPPIKTL